MKFYSWLMNEAHVISAPSRYPDGSPLSLKYFDFIKSKTTVGAWKDAGYDPGDEFIINRSGEPEETIELGRGKESIIVTDKDGKVIKVTGSKGAIEGSFTVTQKDPHELMTAALCLNNEVYSKVEDPDAVIESIKSLATDVVGHTKAEVDAFDSNYDALAAAISASNSILQNFSNSIDRAFITGRQWANEIKGFKMSSGTIKDYNSSDIVIRDGKDFLGVSLKKKGRSTERDPTLINNAVESFFEGILDKKDIDSIHEAKIKFFKEKVLNIDERISEKELFTRLREYIKDKDNKKRMVKLLKSKENIFFRQIDHILKINTKGFIEKFLKTAFRVDLKNLKKYDFDFALVTGVGRYLKKSGIVIEKAHYSSIENTVSALDDIIGNKKLKLEKPKGKKQAFEPGATSVTLTYYIIADDKPLIEIEVRYKGDYAGNPSFQAYATPVLKNII